MSVRSTRVKRQRLMTSRAHRGIVPRRFYRIVLGQDLALARLAWQFAHPRKSMRQPHE